MNFPLTLDSFRRRARSAFMCFSNANRDKIKAANPNIAFGDVGKKLGEAWKEASQEEKKVSRK